MRTIALILACLISVCYGIRVHRKGGRRQDALWEQHLRSGDRGSRSSKTAAAFFLAFSHPLAGWHAPGYFHSAVGGSNANLARWPLVAQCRVSSHPPLRSTRHADVFMRLLGSGPIDKSDAPIQASEDTDSSDGGDGGDGGGGGGGDGKDIDSGESDSQEKSVAVIPPEEEKEDSEEDQPSEEQDTNEERLDNETNATKKVLIIMSDTGGGHKASGRAIQLALEELYEDKLDFEMIDLWTDYGVWPFTQLVPTYAYMAARPWMWRLMYEYAQFPPTRWFSERWCALACWGGVKRCFAEQTPDMIISVHPLCQTLPVRVINSMHGGEEKRQEKLPFVTVVTDLGSSHPTWFHEQVDLTFVPSDVIEDMAKKKNVPEDKLRKYGLPIGPGFRPRSRKQRRNLRDELGLAQGLPTALLVGGGDGVGSLGTIANELADELSRTEVDKQLVVVCGKNEYLKAQLQAQEWPENVKVSVQGFVGNMDKWMGAADAIITKAGPGTIAEACASGLPIMLSSFLPGQEAGNVPFVVDGGFGSYSTDPKVIAQTVTGWLEDSKLLANMRKKSQDAGRPQATKEIAAELGKHLFPEE